MQPGAFSYSVMIKPQTSMCFIATSSSKTKLNKILPLRSGRKKTHACIQYIQAEQQPLNIKEYG